MLRTNSKELQDAYPAKEDQYLCPILMYSDYTSSISNIIDNKI